MTRVETWNELRAAWQEQDRRDTEIEVCSTIAFPPGEWLKPIPSDRWLTLRFAEGAGFDFNSIQRGDAILGGLQFRGRVLEIQGGEFRNFHANGSAIKIDTPIIAVLDGCRFRDIGNLVYPPLTWPVTQATDTIYTQTIGMWSKLTTLLIRNCHWSDCGFASRRWGHCIYVQGRNVLVSGCTFERCGSAFALDSAEGVEVRDCEIRNSRICHQAGEEYDYPHLWYYAGTAPFVALGNTISGSLGFYACVGDPGVCRFENKVDCETTRYFARVGSETMTPEQWRERGFDK